MIIAKKGAGFYLSFPAIDSTTPASYKSGISPVDTAYYKDGAGAWTSLAITDTASEIGATGMYEIDLTAAEMNHDRVVIKFSASGMADDGYQFDLQTKLVDDLNDIAATAIVSGGAIDTTTGAIDNVTTVATTTTNTDMRGTDSAATAIALATVDGVVDAILVDTADLQANQGAWATATETTISAATANQIADHVLRRTWASMEASSDGDAIVFRSLAGAVAKLVNKVAVSGTDLLTYRDDDSTVLGTQALTTDALAEPITAMDTTG